MSKGHLRRKEPGWLGAYVKERIHATFWELQGIDWERGAGRKELRALRASGDLTGPPAPDKHRPRFFTQR